MPKKGDLWSKSGLPASYFIKHRSEELKKGTKFYSVYHKPAFADAGRQVSFVKGDLEG